MSTFPATAKLFFKGYGKTRESGLSRTDMETGPAKQLQTKTRVMVTRTLTYALDSAADYIAFIAWYRDTLHLGADWFDWTDPEDGTVKSARIVNQIDKERPRRSALDRWEVDLKIETWG